MTYAKVMKFRHSTRESEIFLFSAKESDEEYYDVAYELTKNLFIGMAKRSLAFNSSKYEIYEPPFVFTMFSRVIKEKGIIHTLQRSCVCRISDDSKQQKEGFGN